jgi:hypothetical protein
LRRSTATSVRIEVIVATFDRVEHKRTGIRTPTKTDRRLSPGQSIIVIAVLSALSWGVLIAGGLGIRALL